MSDTIELSRFVKAHQGAFRTALREIGSGRKRSHWMWYIFPQVRGLGHSDLSQYYAIRDLDEAAAFLRDPYLCGNLLEICNALLSLETGNAAEVFGKPDDRKLRSSMTLFSLVPGADPVFQRVLDKFFDGKPDGRTRQLLGI